MSKALEADDLETGMLITVLEWMPVERPIYSEFGMTVTGTMTHMDHSWCGEVLKVIVVDFPYVAVKAFGFKEPIKLDLRRCRLGRISEDYAKAMNRVG
jgi:hypothetical protein